jgi:hypothetical protein
VLLAEPERGQPAEVQLDGQADIASGEPASLAVSQRRLKATPGAT